MIFSGRAEVRKVEHWCTVTNTHNAVFWQQILFEFFDLQLQTKQATSISYKYNKICSSKYLYKHLIESVLWSMI